MVDLPPRVAACRCVSCSEGNCHVDLTGLAAQVEVVRLECVKKLLRLAGRMCDCGIVWKNRPLIAAVELKGGKNLVIETTPTDDERSYHISTEKIKKELGFVALHTIEDAVNDLVDAFLAGKVPNPMTHIRYYNIRTMQQSDLLYALSKNP